MSGIEFKTVNSKRDLTEFIKLQWNFYQDDPYWVPPLIMDRKKLLDRNKNPFFEHAEMEMFIAYRDGEAVGRIAAITNENHNNFHEDKMGFFGFFESVNDQEVATALLDKAAEWLKAHDRDTMMGPMNPSTNDEAGMLIDGFDKAPYLMMTHNPRYYMELMDNYGMEKAKDLYAWEVMLDKVELSEKMLRVGSKVQEKYGLTLRNLKLKKLNEELELVRQVYNDAWSKNWGFVPMTEAEINHAADDLKQIADEDLLLIAEKDGRPIGFSVTIPNINEVLIKIPNGKLFPTGLFKLLTGQKKIRTVRVIILGIVKEFQFAGLGSMFYLESIRRAKEKGLAGGEMSWILEDNHTMNRAIQSLGSEKHKTYRIYQKSL
jgi:GNAT superfamily N-acetyltransferase